MDKIGGCLDKIFYGGIAFIIALCILFSIVPVEYVSIILSSLCFIIILSIAVYFITWHYKNKYAEKEYKMETEYREKIIAVNQKKIELDLKVERFENATSGDCVLFTKIPTAIADLRALAYDEVVDWLKYKPHPAKNAAEIIGEYKKIYKDAVKDKKIATYKLEALLSIFPKLTEYIEDENAIEEISRYVDLNSFNSTRDVAKDYLSNEEWKALSTTERNQLALDRYVEGRKKYGWAIGRDYEMCCSFMYETKGYIIERCGIEKRLEDLGRDIIAIWDKGVSLYYTEKLSSAKKRLDKANKAKVKSTKLIEIKAEREAIEQEKQSAQAEYDYWMQEHYKKPLTLFEENHEDIVEVVQCKYWGKDRIIREKYIMQLYGTTKAYAIENSLKMENVVPVLIIPSFSVLSETAQKFIEVLKITVVRQDLVDYPRIKCNINGEDKIYHLPFDQQYDTTKIDKKGEFYAWTVKEAEDKGFRRAMRHIINNP